MTNKDALFIRKITSEYVSFMERTNGLIEETRRATVLTLKKALELEDGDQILIKDDGSIEVEKCKECGMPENKKESLPDRITLNGRETTMDEINRQREAIKDQRGAKLEEVSKGNFKLRVND